MGLKGAIIPGSKLDQIINKSKGTMNDAPPIKAPSHRETAENFANEMVDSHNLEELMDMLDVIKTNWTEHLKFEYEKVCSKKEQIEQMIEETK